MKLSVLFSTIGLLSLLIIGGCGQQADEPVTTEVDSDTIPAVNIGPDFSRFGDREQDAQEIWANVDNTIERLRYGDKTGLYENEFAYFRDEKTMDDYLIHGEVSWANADSLSHIEVLDIIFYGRDSALVDANMHSLSASGEVAPSFVRWTAHYHEGRWIKPYMSRMNFQLEFDELLRQADDAANEDW
jgi:hypothetical protein